MATCSVDGCKLEAYGGFDECVLHCDKSNKELSYEGFEEAFINCLVDLFISRLDYYLKCYKEVEMMPCDHEINVDGIKKIKKEKDKIYKEIFEYGVFYKNLESQDFIDGYYDVGLSPYDEFNDFGKEYPSLGRERICSIHFPENYDLFYLGFFKSSGFTLVNCVFYEEFHNDDVLNISFNGCEFRLGFIGSPRVYLEGCGFYGDVKIIESTILSEDESSSNIFYQCDFSHVTCLRMKNITFNKPFSFALNNLETYVYIENCVFISCFYHESNANIKKIKFLDCSFENKVIFNKIYAGSLSFERCKFKKELIIDGEGLNRDIIIGRLLVYMAFFQGDVFINACNFGVNEKNASSIANTKIKGVMSLINSKFDSGFIFKGFIFEDNSLNLSGLVINYKKSSRDTFRIIKDSFDKSGNHLEANKYYALEMKKYEEEIRERNSQAPITEKTVFTLNKHISNFGQSYVKPILWMIFFATINLILSESSQSYGLYSTLSYQYAIDYFDVSSLPEQVFYGVVALIFLVILVIGIGWKALFTVSVILAVLLFGWCFMSQHFPDISSSISYVLNGLASKIIPFQGILEKSKGIEFITLIFHIIFGVLLWQTIIAVKRHTRR